MNPSRKQLRTVFSFGDFLFYTCLLAVPFVAGIAAIARHSVPWAVLFVVFSAGVVGLIVKFYCTRCPHYTREGKTLKCIFFWGIPKFFTPRGGGYDWLDLAVTGLATAAFAAFPVYWLLMEPVLLLVYILSFAGFGAAIYRNECERCIHMECPMNRAEQSG